VLSALASNTDVPVPAAICLCEDPAVIGTPFYVMDFVAGRIFEDPAIPGVTAEERAQMWRSALQTLARLHSVDFAKVGLGDFGKVGGFYGRQIRTLGRISKAQAEVRDVDTGSPVGEIPGWMGFMSYFKGSLPQERTAIVHGDYKIDNLVFHPTEPRVVGILDWELSTLGHPLADLCNLLSPYLYAEHPQASLGADPEAFLRGRTPGLPTKEEAVTIYEEAAGWKVQRIKWGEAFMACRNAVITQGITARRARGQASSAHAAEYERLTPELARLAGRLVEEDREERAGMVKL
jgi:aminoglycoside phosphotransferase (APT) family kinase protein